MKILRAILVLLMIIGPVFFGRYGTITLVNGQEITPIVHPPVDSIHLYLPLLIGPQRPTIGAQLITSENNGLIVPGSIVMTAVKWAEIEATRGIYIWPRIWLDDYKLVLQIKYAPEWARGLDSKLCAPPLPQYLENFINFAVSAAHNYKPLALVVWNEPDAGCIEDPAYYAAMVAGVYTRLQTDSGPTPVIAGEFRLDAIPSPYIETFLNEAENDFNILSFHRYEWAPTTDGVVQRISYLQGLTARPLALTETSMLCDDTSKQTCSAKFENEQADYLKLISNLPGLKYVFWYSAENNGWRKRDFPRPDGTIKIKLWCLYVSLTGWNGPTPPVCQ